MEGLALTGVQVFQKIVDLEIKIIKMETQVYF